MITTERISEMMTLTDPIKLQVAVRELIEEVQALNRTNASFAERIAAQSDLLTRRATNPYAQLEAGKR